LDNAKCGKAARGAFLSIVSDLGGRQSAVEGDGGFDGVFSREAHINVTITSLKS
jgi:hypothetical protein